MNVLTVPQGSNEWWKARQGIPTASNFSRFTNGAGKLSIARAKDSDDLSDGAKTYAAELIAGSLGWAKDGFKGSPDIERGNELEDMARKYLAFELGGDIEEVGFVLSECKRYGGSPDGLLSGEIPVELKCPDLHTAVKYQINGGGVPAEYLAQVHGQMIVTGAPYAYFCAYTTSPKIRNVLVKVERDAFTRNLEAAVTEFCDRLDAMRREILSE